MKKHVIAVVAAALALSLVLSAACKSPAEFELSAFSINPSEVVSGEPATIEVDVENVGGSEGNHTVTLRVDEVEVESRAVVLDAGAGETVSFTYTATALGARRVELGDLSGTLNVIRPAQLEVRALEVTPSLVLPGDEASVLTEVANVGDVEGSLKVLLTVDGIETDERRVTLAANATEELSFTVVRDRPGDYEIGIGELSATLNVPEVETYHSETYNYSISYPKGWMLDETLPEMVLMTKLGIGGIVLVVEDIPLDMSLEDYEQLSVETAELALDDFELVSQTEVLRDGAVAAYDLSYRFTEELETMQSRVLIWRSGGYAFTVQGIVQQSTYHIHEPLLNASLDSFTLPVVATGPYTNTIHGFSLVLPGGWDAMESGDNQQSLIIRSPVEGPRVSGVLLTDRIYESTTAEEYVSGTIGAISTLLPGLQIVSQSDVTLGAGTRGHTVVSEIALEGMDLRVRLSLTSVVRGTQVFTIQVSAPDDVYDARSHDIDELIRSFTLEEPRPFGVSRQDSLFLAAGDIVTLDPALSETSPAGIIGAIFSGLVVMGEDLEAAPDIAESWDVSDDGQTYTFHLREGVKFHDGKPLTAADVKYSWERACLPETESKKASTFLGDIVGAREMLAGDATELSGVRVIDDLTLEVTIDGPRPYFLDKLTYATAFVVDRANVARGMNWTDEPNGTGAFKMKEWKKDELLVLERNDDFYSGPAGLEHLVFQIFSGYPMMMYEQGEIDATPIGFGDLERVQDPGDPLHDELLTQAAMDTAYLGFNVTMPPFDDPKVRRAFALALDVDKILEVSLKGIAKRTSTYVPPGVPGHNDEPSPLPFDPEQARQLIAESRYGSVANLPPIVFHALYALSPDEEAMISMWQQNLGVTVQGQITEELEEWLAMMRDRELQLFRSGWIADYVDPQNFLEVLFHSQSDENLFAYSNPDVDAALEEAAVERNEQERLEMYRDIERTILEDLPALPIYGASPQHMLVKPYVRGFQLFPVPVNIWKDISIEPH